MVLAPASLPTRFPCWCRAVYSWGGESKRDLGFVEGDLIECLNAGDGSWWVGRLYRDRRTVGSFPSNFVEVLPTEFRPMTRSVSPLPPSNTPSPKGVPSKSQTFRKPFEAYAKAPHYTSAKQPEVFREALKPRPRENSAASLAKSLLENPEKVPSPPPTESYISRSPSPAPSFTIPPGPPQHLARPDSPPPPAPPPHWHVGREQSLELSEPPMPSRQYSAYSPSRQNSTASYRPSFGGRREDLSIPPHDSQSVQRHGSMDTYDTGYNEPVYHTPRARSPAPHSSGTDQLTPSPLREAMDGVMEQLGQLEGLGTGQHSRTSEPDPNDPWDPEWFGLASPSTTKKESTRARPKTAMGIAHPDEGYETWSGGSSQDTSHYGGRSHENGGHHEQTRLSGPVDRFRGLHHHSASMPVVEYEDEPPALPPKGIPSDRPKSSMGTLPDFNKKLYARKSAYELGGGVTRTYTTKTTTTNASTGNQSHTSSSTQSSGRTLWSGVSASGFSSTSAGSMARNHHRSHSALGMREPDIDRPETPFTGVTYHSSHASDAQGHARHKSQIALHEDSSGLGGLVHPKEVKSPKRNIFKKIFDSAKTGVASNRGSVAIGYTLGSDTGRSSPFARSSPMSSGPITASSPALPSFRHGRDAAREMGLSNGVDWVQVRRDVNRSNSLSRIERCERKERCQMLDHPSLNPVDELYESIEGDEGVDGEPIHEPVDYLSINLGQVDKNSRFISGIPSATNAITLATTYVCRPYRSDVQRLRAIFTWVTEKIRWEEDFEGEIDTTRVIQAKRACAQEYAVLVAEMCKAVGIECEVVRGYLKPPGEIPELNMMPRSNHWWNAVVIDTEWRIMDCCLTSPSNPKRGLYSSVSGATADPWWFLAKPLEACWTHVPEHHDQQHIVPPVAHEILLNLPCTCPNFFRNGLEMVEYNTSLTRIEDLEMVHVQFNVPADVEVAAVVETRAYATDSDGDLFESGDVVKTRALAQAEWFGGVKRYMVKALLPGDEGQGTLKIYAGKRGLMHSIKDIPHPLAFSLPITHTGENPPYDFVTRHPTPHAQRHDIYVVQPQCRRLALNNTFVFAIRQHPSLSGGGGPQSALTPSSNPGGTSPLPWKRPSSAMSMHASSTSASNPSSASGTVAGKKPAKLAIQTPGGKILRLMRKEDRKGISVGSKGGIGDEEVSDGGTWETIIKCSEKGVWRGLVLADRTARWCVFAEWVCMG